LGWNWGYHAKYRQGLDIHAKIEDEAFFNWHVVLMMFGFFLPNAIAAGAFRFFTFLPVCRLFCSAHPVFDGFL